jgi:primosomal protein N' (replication factor Y)
VQPVARVALDVPLPHLDRPFDYLVPEDLAGAAVAGVRVRVRFAGRLTAGYLLGRADSSEHAGELAFLERVVSPEPVLSAEIAGLARAVADRYGGTMADVLRLAIPPRHAAAEKGRRAAGRAPAELARTAGPALAEEDAAGQPGGAAPAAGGEPGGELARAWDRYPAGASFLAALQDGRSPRAVWSALPGPDWPQQIALAVRAAVRSRRGALVVVPDARDLALTDSALAAVLGPDQHVILAAQLGPAERYRRWLAVLHGEVRVVAGTRSAMFAPVSDLGLAVIWDDGDDLHAEPRAPYPHAREVLALRAHRARGGLLAGGFARTAEAAQLLATGWARPLQAERAVVRRLAPAVTAAGATGELARDPAARTARLPSLALRTARAALQQGPVLFQVPRRGYLPAVSCAHCQATARCIRCGGPVTMPAPAAPLSCGWCGSPVAAECASCGRATLRALVTGARRTAEELGRALAPAPVLTSGRAEIIAEVTGEPAVVVATPGAEPRADGGYAAAVLLDGWALLGRASLRAAEEALRRWMNAAALVRPGPAGGSVVVVADAGLAPVQALVRWDPAGHAERELAERRELRFPPAVSMASVAGPADAVSSLLVIAELPAGAEVLGPVPVTARPGRPASPADHAAELRPEAAGLAAALRAAQAVRSAAKQPGAVRIQLDPSELI